MCDLCLRGPRASAFVQNKKCTFVRRLAIIYGKERHYRMVLLNTGNVCFQLATDITAGDSDEETTTTTKMMMRMKMRMRHAGGAGGAASCAKEWQARCRRKEGRSQGCRGCRPLHWWEAQEAAQAGGERLSQESDNAGSLWQIRMYPDWTACGCIPNLGVPSASVLHISRMYCMVYRVGIR